MALLSTFSYLVEVHILIHSELNLAIDIDRADQISRVYRVQITTRWVSKVLLDFLDVHPFVKKVLVNSWVFNFLVYRIKVKEFAQYELILIFLFWVLQLKGASLNLVSIKINLTRQLGLSFLLLRITVRALLFVINLLLTFVPGWWNRCSDQVMDPSIIFISLPDQSEHFVLMIKVSHLPVCNNWGHNDGKPG